MHGNGKRELSSARDDATFRCISGDDAIKILELIHDSVACSTKEDFAHLFPRLQELFPFDFGGATLVDAAATVANPLPGLARRRSRTANEDRAQHLECLDLQAIGQIAGFRGVNFGLPMEYFRETIAHRFFHRSVVTREHFRSYKVQYWPESWKRFGQPKDIRDFLISFGMGNGYSHGCGPRASGNLLWLKGASIFCHTGPSVRYEPRTASILELLSPHLHLALTRVLDTSPGAQNKAMLSGREKEVLNWLKQGKTSWDISVILHISQRTVNFHVYNILDKLGVSNRPEAVAVAVHQGLLDLD